MPRRLVFSVPVFFYFVHSPYANSILVRYLIVISLACVSNGPGFSARLGVLAAAAHNAAGC